VYGKSKLLLKQIAEKQIAEKQIASKASCWEFRHSCFVYTAVGFAVVARLCKPQWLALKYSPKEQG
jgi:hypothetical protein